MRCVAFTFLFCSFSLFADNGALTPDMIASFHKRVVEDGRSKLLINAATQNKLRELALNHELSRKHDPHYTDTLKTGGVTNQKGSGRCWLFAGLNILRPPVVEKYKLKDFEFSENYCFFWDKLEKANLFLEGVIETRDRDVNDRLVVHLLKTPFPDGGQWHMVVALAEKYGLVPKSVMPETDHSSGTGDMNRLINRKLRSDAAALRALHGKGKPVSALREEKTKMLSEIYRLLCYHFGTPPEKFMWRYKDKDDVLSDWTEYTPKSFYKQFVALDLSDYICLYNCPAHPYGRLYEVQFCRDFYDQSNMTFINLEIDVLKDAALKQLRSGEPVWFGCDVGKEFQRSTGILRPGIYDYESLLDMNFDMTKKERILYRESIPTHAMVFQGVDIRFGKPVKWYVENSWGTDRGDKGYLNMYDSWFDEYLYSVVVKKSFLPADVLDVLKQRPVVLPPWDPMYGIVR